MNNVWDERFASSEFIYGREPNEYFKAKIDSLKPGKILIPGAGEGRDAVYAALKGWTVFAFDMSSVAMQKAMNFAEEKKVIISYDIINISEYNFKKHTYDAVALTFVHLPNDLRKFFHSNIYQSVSMGGHIILEAFTPKQLNYKSGGPSDINMLYTKDQLSADFHSFKIIENTEQQVILNEGNLHKGIAETVRFFGEKI